MIRLGINRIPFERPKPPGVALAYACPIVVFVLSIPLFLAVLPPPHTEFDYLVVGSAATCFGLLTVLLVVAHRQMAAFERKTPPDRTPGRPSSNDWR